VIESVIQFEKNLPPPPQEVIITGQLGRQSSTQQFANDDKNTNSYKPLSDAEYKERVRVEMALTDPNWRLSGGK
jgi:hypothetical protein